MRFPARTVILMVLALAAFARLFYMTHHPAEPRHRAPTHVDVITLAPDGGRI